MIVISSRKDHFGIMFDTFQDLQAGQTRHSHIQKNQIGAQIIDECYRAIAVRRFTYDFQPVFTLDEVLDRLPGQRFVLNDQRAN